MPKIELEVSDWATPNVVEVKRPPRPRQEGFTPMPGILLADASANLLAELCDNFRAEVFRKAGKQDPRNSDFKIAGGLADG